MHARHMQPQSMEYRSKPIDGFPRKCDRRMVTFRFPCSLSVLSCGALGCQQDAEAVLEGDKEGVGARVQFALSVAQAVVCLEEEEHRRWHTSEEKQS